MTIRSGLFNSVNGDRKYNASQFAEYFNSFIGNGVFPNPSDNLQVISNNDMTVTIKAGKAWINGYILINDDDYILQIEPADGVLNRIDRIVAKYDTTDREIRLEIKKGTFASVPVAPTIQRDADAYELGIADIAVNAGVISISQGEITDLRLNDDYCGIVHGLVDQVDVTTLYNQYTEGFRVRQAEFEQAFNDWFAAIQGILDGDTAGNLLNIINDLAGEGRTTETVKGNADAIAALAGEGNTATVKAVDDALDSHLADITSYAEYRISTNSSLNSGVVTNITLDTQVKAKSFCQLNSGNVKILKSGTYHILAQLNYQGNTTGYRISGIKLNDVALRSIAIPAINGAQATDVQISFYVDLIENDNLTLYGVQNSGAALNVQANVNTFLQIKKVN